MKIKKSTYFKLLKYLLISILISSPFIAIFFILGLVAMIGTLLIVIAIISGFWMIIWIEFLFQYIQGKIDEYEGS